MYFKNNIPYNNQFIEYDNKLIFNPTKQQLLDAGYVEQDYPVSYYIDNKIKEIQSYSNSSKVNNLVFKGINTFLTPEVRSNYYLSIMMAKNTNKPTIKFSIGTNLLELPTDQALDILTKIQDYADKTYLVTINHINSVKQLTTKEAVESYDYTKNYPEILKFN